MEVLKRTGIFLGHIVVAVFGTAVLSVPIEKAHRAASIESWIGREVVLSVVCAGVIGFGMGRTWKSAIGLWTWTLPTAIFSLRAMSIVTFSHSGSVLLASGGFWPRIFGVDCLHQVPVARCLAGFFLLTIPFLRSVAYSLGTLIGMRFAVPGTVRELRIGSL
jgi:hypothetical protein